MSEPLYRKVYNSVLERIADGEYPAGSMLPSEMDLASELKVSQGTARKALIELEQRGIVQRQQGKGTFVTLRTPENALFHFFSMRDAAGNRVAPELMHEDVALRSADETETALLYGQPSEVIEINRVRSFGSAPLCYETTIVSAQMFPGLADRSPLPNALYVMFQQAYSCIIISAEENLTAASLTDTIASKLQVPAGTPAIVAHRKSRDLRERLVELRTSIFLTENTSYLVELS